MDNRQHARAAASRRPILGGYWLLLCAVGWCVGCGTTREKLATQQMLLSDAVDRAVARIDFAPLSGEKVYLDTTYIHQIKGEGFVNADYIISSLRQQMVLAGCLLQENREAAKYVAEARVGVLGNDAHDVNYGVPGSQGISAAATLVSGGAPLPAFPEISLARKADDTAASKIAVFAYDRESREPVWQSGLSVARSSAHARWVLGVGPFQSGTIYEGTQFAGDRLKASKLEDAPPDALDPEDTAYRNPAVWDKNLQGKLRGPEGSTASQVAADNGSTTAPDADGPSAVGNEPAAAEVAPVEYNAEVPSAGTSQ